VAKSGTIGERNRQAGSSGRGYCWPIGKTRRFSPTVQRCVEFATASASDRVACSLREDAGFPLSSRAFLRRCSGCRPADQQFGPPHAATGCICIEVTIAVPVANASASKARMSVVTFMIFSPKADRRIGAFFVFLRTRSEPIAARSRRLAK
jgi:hypothetical protein